MTDKITSVFYRYKLQGSNSYDCFFVPGEQIDDLIGGVASEIINGEVVFHIYDLSDETMLNHPWVTWWDKKIIEKEVVLTKLPTKKGNKINWKSRNRGGGVKHKNFDKTDAKLYYKETERVINPKSKPPKKVEEPPMGIINIIKKEEDS